MLAARSAVKSLRSLSTSAVVRSSHDESTKRWRNASLFLAMPAVLLCMANAFVGTEHEHRPEFKPYEHMYIRTSKFPWGDGNHSLIHNKERNALPDGYEELEEL